MRWQPRSGPQYHDSEAVMTHSDANPKRALATHCALFGAGLALMFGAGCKAGSKPDPSAMSGPGVADVRLQRAVDDALRALFPEVQGDLTRASIARALADGAASGADSADVPTAAIAAIRSGDYPLARGLLGELVARKEVEKAREFLAAGDERAAIAVLDRAVATAPDSAALRTMRAEAELRVAEVSHDLDFARSALEDFQDAAKKRGGPRAYLGASRAARVLGRTDEALAFARTGLAALDGADVQLPGAESAERVWAEASLDAFGRGAQGGAGGDLARESLTALHSSIARSPEDPWAWRALTSLDLARGEPASARRTATRALQLFPADAQLHGLLYDALAKIGGSAAVLAEYEQFTAREPRIGSARLNLARARFESALDALAAKRTDAVAQFGGAEADFARAGTLEQSLAAECARNVALCRTGAGFARFAAHDLDGARDAFLSVEDASKGALALELGPGLQSGVAGLAAVGRAYGADSGRPGANSIDGLERALRVFEYLREYDRTSAQFAAQAAISNRDAAIAIELDARSLASQKKIEDANRRLVRARELMESSLKAFEAALALAPDDARIAFDAGAVLTNYLQRDAQKAEAWLTRAAEIWEARAVRLAAQRETPGLDAAQKRAVVRELEEVASNASDAYECLGVLCFTLKGDALAARTWFEKSLAKSTEPRESVQGKGGWLDRCRAAIESKSPIRTGDEKHWGAPLEKTDDAH